MPEHVDAIRWHIEETDNQIMDLIGQRMRLAKEMGQHKLGKGIPVRNQRVEDQVMARFASRAKQADVSEEAARKIAKILLHESEDAQFRMPRGDPKRITVIGGSGKMGAWLCRFFDSQGHKVLVNDIVSSTSFPYENDLKRAVSQADVIVISTPIDTAKDMLDKVLALKPKGLVMDVISIKAPLIVSLRAAAEKGTKVCSLHPMFGPDTTSLIYQNLLVCECGSKEGVAEAHSLFEGTGAELHDVSVEEHDRLMSYVLGMSHALNIAFFNALVKSGLSIKELDDAASTTFRHQRCTSRRVANENPELYYQIQHVNPHSKETLDLLVRSLEEIRAAATAGESDDFVRIMEQGRAYYGGSE
ncbi:MAG: prephenate dehydrogenase/arogenate dehydrogenase family protein [Methanomassiliicoccales archaeon]|nr:prephenate dehydrogenase/arogenate dehydrogenase family protein [Methanomassiliicoccales archaeon]MDD1757077.1 prephenate dehydrogenase/arogenate dehydrogenase family protein [Methanomassiliicoccales archaeon]